MISGLFKLFFAISVLQITSCSIQRKDIHSFSNPDQVRVKHIHLDLNVDFFRKQLSGFAKLDIEMPNQADSIILDSRDLTISQVLINDSLPTDFSTGKYKPKFGSPLSIAITPEAENIKIFYNTSPDAAALQWLTKEQTQGKEYPFLFSQSQFILARSWVPCQDTPTNRFTYTARIKTDPQFLALMSASNPIDKNADGVYSFRMEQPIPSYLMAIAVGDLQFRSLGEKCGIYSEPQLIESAAYEFGDTDKMIKTAEALYGPYLWERYDILVLPPSFPYGGMENPRLTFVTPTLLAGDRSLVSVIAHELAHSWSGNLVTNAYWDDFWINEGFTRYFELRIMEELYGKEYTTMIEQLGYQKLMNTIARLGPDSLDTRLAMDLSGRHPDENSGLAYEKGARFLRSLEVTYGREKFDPFLNTYFSTFAFQTMTSDKFADYVTKNLIQKNMTTTSNTVKVYEWIYGTGMPDKYEVPQSRQFTMVDEQRNSFINGTPAKELNVKNWTAHHWIHFLKALPRNLSFEQLQDLDNNFNFTKSRNAEIAFVWLDQTIKLNYHPANKALESFLKRIGRNKFLKPLYTSLAASPNGKEKAREIFEKNRARYHPVTVSVIEKILDDAQ